MSESTTIDTLSIEITSNSGNAAAGIDALAASLGKLKQNGSVSVAVRNLNNLSTALKGFTSVASNASKISSLASAVTKLSGAGSFSKVISQLNKLPSAVKGLDGVDFNGLDAKFEKIANAASKLSGVKAGGLGAMVNALGKLDKVTDSLNDATITAFAKKVRLLSNVLTPLSSKMTSVAAGFKAINSSARTAASGVGHLGSKVNATNLNFASIVTVLQGVISALRPVINLLINTISAAMEWDGISQRFGRGFGEQAEEVYAWVQRLNKEMGINIQTFMQYSSTYATMLTGFGVAQKDASQMALGYMELTYDIWAGYNDIYKTMDEAAMAVRSAIAGEVEPVRKAGFTIIESTLEQTAANHGLEISLENATEAQKSYLRYLTLVDQAHAQNLVGTYAREMNTAEGLTRTFAQQIKSLGQSFGSLFLPILVKVMPWLQAFVDLLTDAIRAVAAFFGVEIQEVTWGDTTSGLGGIADSAGDASGALKDTEDSIDGVTEALKDLKKATIGIDELNVISPPASSGGGAGGGWGPGGNGGLGDLGIGSLWDESIFDQIQFEVDSIKEKLKEALTQIEAVISGFMLAVGTILVVSGANIPLGLALMAVGAVGLVAVIAQNWNSMSEQLAKTLTVVTSVLGGFLLAIGAFLVFSGVNVGLGAALMAAGAVSLATAATINWKFLNKDMKNALSTLTAIVGGALLAMGALFAFTGVDVPLGIALMVGGAVGIATSVALNWNTLSEPMRKAIGVLEAIVGGSLLAFGAILTFTGANLPLGLGLIAAGAVSLVSAVVLNWGSLTGNVKNTIATITAILSGSLLGIGGILAFTGHIPLGIALIAAGAVGLVASAPINWSSLTNTMKTVIKEIGAAIGAALLAVGAILAFSGASIPLGIAMMAVGGASLVGAVALNWDFIVSKVKSVVQKIGVIAGSAMLALGILLVCTGVGLPLGIGLIAAGAAGLVGGIALNWDFIVNKVKNTVTQIGAAWDGLWGSCKNGIKKMWDGVVGWFTDLWDTLVGHSIVPDTINAIVEWFTSLPGKTVGAIKNFVTGIVDKFKNLGTSLSGKFSDAWNSVKTWWSKKPSLSTYVPSIGSIKEKLSSAWNTAKSWWSKSKGKLAEYTPSIGSIKSKLSSAWSTAKSWWNRSKGSMSYTPTIGNIKSKLQSAWSTAKSWWSRNVKLSIPSLSFKVTYTNSGLGTVKKAIVKALGLSGWPKLSFAANGGIFDTGSLIWAGEAGAEIVANAGGGKTGVMNVDQMSEAVYEGVYSAVIAAMRATSGNDGDRPVNVYLDSKQITSAVERRQHERGASIMGNQVYRY